MNIIPLLIQPRIAAIKNRWRDMNSHKTIVRDLVIACLAGFLMVCTYQGTYWCLHQIYSQPLLASLPPNVPLGMAFTVLFSMLLLSGIASSLGTLYLAEDLDLILASPISPHRFFFGKYLLITISSSWMPILFLCPFLMAFGRYYQASSQFYILIPFVLAAFFLIPVSISILLATSISTLIPASRTRLMRFFLIFCFLFIIAFVLSILRRSITSPDMGVEIIRLFLFLGAPTLRWFPGNWATNCFFEALRPSGSGAIPELILLSSSALFFTALAYLIISSFHFHIYSRTKSHRTSRRYQRSSFEWLDIILSPFVLRSHRAMITKEFRNLSRDITALVELCLLFGLCVIYLYNLRVFSILDAIPVEQQHHWRSILFGLNSLIHCFVITAICTRFVYPSISREGRSFWILSSSPLPISSLMKVKYQCWSLPVCLVSLSLSVISGFVLAIPSSNLFITSFAGLVVSLAIVRSAVGFGAFFVNFDWDHPSELAASFGSFVYMLFGISLIFLSMGLTSVVLSIRVNSLFSYSFSEAEVAGISVLCIMAVVLLNEGLSRWMLQKGTARLVALLDK